MSVFTAIELARLHTLRTRYQLGDWPRPVRDSFAERYGIRMTVTTVEDALPDRTIYQCTLRRVEGGTVVGCFQIRFQVLATNPEPPGVDEVLRWLATTAAHAQVANDLPDWALLCGIETPVGTGVRPFRGLVREATSIEEFAGSLARDAVRLQMFLGPTAFSALMAEVDAT